MSLLDDLNGSVEEEKELVSKKDEALKDIINNIEEEYELFQNYHFGEYMEAVKIKLDFSITPEAIISFIQKHKGTSHYTYDFFPFGAMLIQNSYNQGHNDFVLPALNNESDLIGFSSHSHLYGQEKNPIKLIINGELAKNYFTELKYAQIKFTGKADKFCAWSCSDSKIEFKDYAGLEAATYSKNCDVYFYEDVGDDCGLGSKKTRFYSPYKANLKQVSKFNSWSNCSYYLIELDGSHTEVHF